MKFALRAAGAMPDSQALASADLAELRFKPLSLAQQGLPDIPYPLTIAALAAAIGNDGELPYADMLHGLQLRSADGSADWLSLEPALDRLSELIANDDQRPLASVAGDNWWLEVGPVDLDGPLVTVQRGDLLLAAICPRGDGRLRVATFRPLDAKSADYLIGMSLHPHPEAGVCMRENNWEYARDCSAGVGNFYAFKRGEAHLSWWEKGIGIMQDGALDLHWHAMRELAPRRPGQVAMELGVRYSLREAE